MCQVLSAMPFGAVASLAALVPVLPASWLLPLMVVRQDGSPCPITPSKFGSTASSIQASALTAPVMLNGPPGISTYAEKKATEELEPPKNAFVGPGWAS